jgi:ribosomal protein S18 acetylase RimI-like enzyme
MSVTVDRIESAGYRAWSPDEIVDIDGWTVTSNGGFTRRLNSASTTRNASTSSETGRRIETWLTDRGAPMTIRVTPLLPATVADDAASAWDLEARDGTPVLVAPPDDRRDDQVEVVDAALPAFVDDLFALNARPPIVRPQWDRLVDRLRSRGVGLRIAGEAVGFVAVIDHVGLVYSVAVAEPCRRRGLATRIMAAAHGWAFDHGAEAMTLQVVGNNVAGRALYDRLGYVELYRYHYLQRPRAFGA